MLKEYQITNFKAFAGPATIPIKPITLIFGSNSSGKSSIIQSLLLLKQTLDDAESPEPTLIAKGSLVDLGSYGEFIHRHELHTPLSFKITGERPDLFDLLPYEEYLANMRNDSENFEKLNGCGEFKTIGLDITFSYEGNNSVNVSKLELYLGENSTPLFIYKNSPPEESHSIVAHSRHESSPNSIFKIQGINVNHPFWDNYHEAFKKFEADFLSVITMGQSMVQSLDKMVTPEEKALSQSVLEKIFLDKFGDIIELRNFLPTPNLLNGVETQYIMFDESEETGHTDSISFFTLAISAMFRTFLENVIYLGPLRDNPERYFTFTGSKTKYVGKTGSHVSDILIRDREILAKVNEQFDRFQIGYQLEVVPLADQASGIHDLYALRLRQKSSDVLVGITDVGFGISQVLPVVVQAIAVSNKTILIEQPELHLHPALQAELGDLFIDSALGEQKNTFIIETHSEHLILRIMRRMRETFEGKLPKGITPVKPEDVAILYVEKDGPQSIIREMYLNDRGELVKAWPGGFFEEALREVLL